MLGLPKSAGYYSLGSKDAELMIALHLYIYSLSNNSISSSAITSGSRTPEWPFGQSKAGMAFCRSSNEIKGSHHMGTVPMILSLQLYIWCNERTTEIRLQTPMPIPIVD